MNKIIKRTLISLPLFLCLFILINYINVEANDEANLSTPDSDLIVLEKNDSMPKNIEVSEEKSESGDQVSDTESIDSGFVRTNGGEDDIDVMYSSVEDAYNQTNPVSISGAGFDGVYINEEEYKGNTYVSFAISGGIFYMEKSEVSLIATEDAMASSHYENVDGQWVFFEAVDALNSTEYEQMVLSEAIEGSIPGQKYYTIDEETFYKSPEELQQAALNPYSTRAITLSGYSYFQNLPFNSSSNHTATEYKNYLKSLGYTDSKYYNYTYGFTDAQSIQGINSLLLFSFANNESAYGTSTFAKTCNNFFGRGAFDNNPGNACESYGFSDPYSGIMAQTYFIQSSYFDVLDWKFNGNHFGNKTSGMNVVYATDPNWGKTNASIAYQVDRANGSTDQGVFAIGKVSKPTTVYKNSSLTTPLKVKGDGTSVQNYVLQQKGGSSSSSDYGIRVLIRKQVGNSYEIQLPTPINNTTSNTCYYKKSQRGSYPTYDGSLSIPAPSGVANYACDYGKFSSQIGYISTSSVQLLNYNSFTAPSESNESVIKEYYSNGNVKYEFHLTNDYIKYAIEYDTSGKKIKYYEYESKTPYGGHASKMKYIFNLNSDGTIDYTTQVSGGNTVAYYEYKSGTKYGNHASKIKYKFNVEENDVISYAEGFNNGKVIKYYEYKNGTKYGEHSSKITSIITLKSDNTIKNKEVISNGVTTNYYEYYTGTKYEENYDENIKYIFNMNSNGTINNAEEIIDSKTVAIYEYFANTPYGNQAPKIKYKFNLDSKGIITYAEGYSNGKINKYFEYNDNTTYGNHSSEMNTIISLKDDGSIKNKEVISNGVTTNYYEYYSGTKYEENYDDNIKYKFNVNSNHIIENTLEIKDGKTVAIFEYATNTKYGEHSSKIKYKFNLDSGGHITYAEGYTNSKVNKYFEYEEGTKYGMHASKMTGIITLKSDNTIKNKEVISNGVTTKYYEYYTGTKYKEDYDENIKYIFNMNSNGTINNTEEKKGSKTIAIYEYSSNTAYDGNHGSKIKYKFVMDGMYIKYAESKDYIFYYQPYTTYGDHSDKIVSIKSK